jgi:DNA polymerase-3 subunit gamma/tau
MDYQVSARKYRPGTFDDVIGQSHVVQTLMNSIATKRIAHAFLFSGTRGVGKTTVARILAKALNCEQGPTGTPCNTCANCREITQGTSVDVVEIDGASNTSVDDVREIRENVKFTPFRGQYRVYIIDEVHMLSNSAFNALLKTLEEPPSHVVFIFATTEIHKIPATILSRCQHYNFRRISKAEIVQRLRHVADQDGLTIEDRSLMALARASEGSMRDGLSLLDQIIGVRWQHDSSRRSRSVAGRGSAGTYTGHGRSGDPTGQCQGVAGHCGVVGSRTRRTCVLRRSSGIRAEYAGGGGGAVRA